MSAPSVAASAGPGRIAEIQRARILAAMTELVRERGVSAVSVAHVVARSGVSRRTFYDLFADRDACLLAAFELAVDRAAAVVLPAYAQVGASCTWQSRLRAALAALLGFLDEDPAAAGLLVVDSLATELSVRERRARVVALLIDAVHDGGRRGPARRPPRIVAEGSVGAVLAIVHARLAVRDPKPLLGLLNQLMAMIVLPYRGAEAALREQRHAVPRPRRRPAAAAPAADPLRELDMRLTYRTLRVLAAIAELGRGGSPLTSRAVADAAGISDQGQASKLLRRLESLGLIADGAHGVRRGEPKAWRLTAKGEEVEQALRARAGRSA